MEKGGASYCTLPTEQESYFHKQKIKTIQILLQKFQSTYLFFQSGILHTQVLLIKVYVFTSRQPTTRWANHILQCLSHGNVLAPELVILSSENGVICTIMLRLAFAQPFSSSNDIKWKKGKKKHRQRKTEKKLKPIKLKLITFIWVLLFWNQNLIWRGSSPKSLLNFILCFSSGCGHSLKNLQTHGKNNQFAIVTQKTKEIHVIKQWDRKLTSTTTKYWQQQEQH